ncbi:dinitrogenase iron-molybdenum cofactor [Vibrio mimicus]|uniref:NifB/NifX family molybdenum-iron cluster-binding protein n=1 Tax=Vibrio mimicus TaxID=674 RepID=UPI0018658099|nr:NifB/NifX family molybdenum-iron cluster-binding protein [Vibrio mimicus]
MIFAVPSRAGMPFNHFSKAPSFSVINSNNQQLQAEFAIENNTSRSCGKKTEILNQLRRYQVEAVVVRQIGQAMLQALFNAGIRVYALPRGAELSDIVLEQLQPVTELSYGKSSPNKPHRAQGCNHQRKRATLINKLAMPTYRGFSVKRLWKGEE